MPISRAFRQGFPGSRSSSVHMKFILQSNSLSLCSFQRTYSSRETISVGISAKLLIFKGETRENYFYLPNLILGFSNSLFIRNRRKAFKLGEASQVESTVQTELHPSQIARGEFRAFDCHPVLTSKSSLSDLVKSSQIEFAHFPSPLLCNKKNFCEIL